MIPGGRWAPYEPGSSSNVIAAAAAEAELIHKNWEDIGGGRVKRTINSSTMYNADFATVTVDTWTGSCETEYTGQLGELSKNTLVLEATSVVNKWPPKIEGLFEKWKGIPTGYEGYNAATGLEKAIGELAIDPDNPSAVGDDVAPANTRLAGDLSALETRTGQLSGQYAQNFSDFYVANLPVTIQMQGMLVATLSVGLNAEAEAWQRTNEDLRQLEVHAHRAMLAARPEGGTDQSLVMALTVVGALASAIGAVPTLGGSVALMGALTAGAASIGAAYESAKGAGASKVEVPLGGAHPDDVYDRMKEGLEEIDTRLKEQEDGIADLLSQGTSVANGGSCQLSDPQMNTAPPGTVLNPHQDLVVNPQTIAKITELWLPSISADLRQSEKALVVTSSNGFTRDAAVGRSPNGAWPEFSTLQTRTSELLVDLGGDLDGAAGKLQAAARLIGLADDQQFNQWEQRANKIEGQNINDADEARTV